MYFTSVLSPDTCLTRLANVDVVATTFNLSSANACPPARRQAKTSDPVNLMCISVPFTLLKFVLVLADGEYPLQEDLIVIVAVREVQVVILDAPTREFSLVKRDVPGVPDVFVLGV